MSEHVISKMGNFEETRKHTHNQAQYRVRSVSVPAAHSEGDTGWHRSGGGVDCVIEVHMRQWKIEQHERGGPIRFDFVDGEDDAVQETST